MCFCLCIPRKPWIFWGRHQTTTMRNEHGVSKYCHCNSSQIKKANRNCREESAIIIVINALTSIHVNIMNDRREENCCCRWNKFDSNLSFFSLPFFTSTKPSFRSWTSHCVALPITGLLLSAQFLSFATAGPKVTCDLNMQSTKVSNFESCRDVSALSVKWELNVSPF